ncbi:hypothetical protein T484DRAFT_3607522 [Baffinella frigidus]|nr:hypothetical protein T484DRAFT_3607522 [Cryptophyta sp. CCMP2293]
MLLVYLVSDQLTIIQLCLLILLVRSVTGGTHGQRSSGASQLCSNHGDAGRGSDPPGWRALKEHLHYRLWILQWFRRSRGDMICGGALAHG